MKETGAFLDENDAMEFEENIPAADLGAYKQIADKLSAENLSQMDAKSKKAGPPSKAGSKKSKASKRPAWALTEK